MYMIMISNTNSSTQQRTEQIAHPSLSTARFRSSEMQETHSFA